MKKEDDYKGNVGIVAGLFFGLKAAVLAMAKSCAKRPTHVKRSARQGGGALTSPTGRAAGLSADSGRLQAEIPDIARLAAPEWNKMLFAPFLCHRKRRKYHDVRPQ
ncbi:hypothetical protein [Rhizobium bangladeshense]|uniref:hypothetical protein n=1 Tax=Rhizobium bangladeshense TaxID=1138189 RepID=UPI0007E53F49|nr:hypothetical protein [Rhizobium bangladeshense]